MSARALQNTVRAAFWTGLAAAFLIGPSIVGHMIASAVGL